MKQRTQCAGVSVCCEGGRGFWIPAFAGMTNGWDLRWAGLGQGRAVRWQTVALQAGEPFAGCFGDLSVGVTIGGLFLTVGVGDFTR